MSARSAPRQSHARRKRWRSRLARAWLGWLSMLLVLLGSTAAVARGGSSSAAAEPLALSGAFEPHMKRPGDAPLLPEAADLQHSMLAVPAGYNTYDGGWIKFRYHPSVLERIQPLIKQADAVKGELSGRLGQRVLPRVDVRVARTPREMRSFAPAGTQVPGYAAGVAYSQIGLVLLSIQPLHPNSQHDLLEIFKHELVHIALHDAVAGKPIPRWFNEGFAVHASGENRTTRLWTLWSATLSEDLMPLSRLEDGFPADPNSASVAYAQAADFVRFLMKSHDEHRFRAAMDRVRAGQPFESALGDAYGSDLNALEYEWLEDVARRYTFWPVLFSSTMVWMGALGLLVWVWRRRKARAEVTLARWAREEAREEARQKQNRLEEEAPRRVHIVLTRPSEPEVPELRPRLREADIPKVEHDGRWHTLH